MSPFENYSPAYVEQPSTPEASRRKGAARKRAAKSPSPASKNMESRELTAEDRLKTDTRRFIEKEIAEIDEPITLDNFREKQEELLEKVKENGFYQEDAERQISAYMGNRVAALGEHRRQDLAMNPEKRRDVSQLDLNHSQWMQSTEDFVETFQDNPEEIRNYWADFDKVFANGRPEVRKNADTFKYGALAQVAAKGLMRELGAVLKKEYNVNAEVRTEHSTAEEDIADKVDFWTVVRFNNREKRIPCQVIFIDIGTTVTQDNREGSDFVKENIVNFQNPDLRNSRYGNRRVKEKIENFFRINDKKSKISAFITLPKAGNVSILDNGTVNDSVRNTFIGNAMRDRHFWDEFVP